MEKGCTHSELIWILTWYKDNLLTVNVTKKITIQIPAKHIKLPLNTCMPLEQNPLIRLANTKFLGIHLFRWLVTGGMVTSDLRVNR